MGNPREIHQRVSMPESRIQCTLPKRRLVKGTKVRFGENLRLMKTNDGDIFILHAIFI